MIFLWFAGAALANRIRGGLFPTGSTTIARAIYSAALTGAALVSTGPDWWLAFLFPAFWLGAILPWFDAIDLGRNDGSFWPDFAILAARGPAWTAPAAGVLYGLDHDHWWIVLIAGLACPVAYALGWTIRSTRRGAHTGPELAEWIFGAVIGVATWASIV